MDSPPNPLNIIIKRVCQQFRHHHVPSSPSKPHREPPGLPRPRHTESAPGEGAGASTSLGNAWLKVFALSGNQTHDKQGKVPMGGAIRTRWSSWHAFSFKGGVLDMESTVNEESTRPNIPDLDLS